MRLHIIVPCYNEEKRLDPQRWLRFATVNPAARLTMVDDGSRDQTLDILHRMADQSSGQIDVHALAENRGKAEAVRQGLLAAMDRPVEFIGFLDADLAAAPESCLHLADVLNRNPQVDIAIGSRLPLAGRQINRNAARGRVGRCFAQLASLVLGTAICDTQCGAKMFRNTPRLRSVIETPFQSRWIFDVELIARYMANCTATQRRQSLYEMPLDAWTEVPGSKLKAGDFVQAAWELGRIAWNYRRGAYVLSSVQRADIETVDDRATTIPTHVAPTTEQPHILRFPTPTYGDARDDAAPSGGGQNNAARNDGERAASRNRAA